MAAHFLRMLAIAGVADAVWPPPRSISHAGDALAVDAQQFLSASGLLGGA